MQAKSCLRWAIVIFAAIVIFTLLIPSLLRTR